MKIHCLFVQRRCAYDGQYAPELYAAIDEYGNEDNPAYLQDEERKARSDDTIVFYKCIDVNIDDDEFDLEFFGSTLRGTIVKEKP